MEIDRKKAIRLFIFWVVCYFVFSIGSSVYASYQEVIVGTDPTVFGGGFQLFTFGIITCLFIPLLCVVLYFVKRSRLEKLHTVVTVLLWLLIIWSCFMLICTILANIAPETFHEILKSIG